MKKIILLFAIVLFFPLFGYAQTTENLEGPCSGDYDNFSDMYECAQKAQYQGAQRGYNIQCAVQTNWAPSSDWTLTYTPFCTVNGQPGHQANLLVGFESTEATNPHINPGWATLNYELSNPPAAISAPTTGQIWTPGGTVGTPGTSGNTGSSNPSTASSLNSSQMSYLSSLLNIVNSMVQVYRSLLIRTAP